MNTKTLIAAAAFLLAGTAFAQNTPNDNGAKTRAQVLAELEQARADGSFYAGGDGTPRPRARARIAEWERHQKSQRRAEAEASRTQN